jgi:hypothetical protein
MAGGDPSAPAVVGARRWLLGPVDELLAALDAVLARASDLVWVFVGLGVGWWIYVPVHELLHVAGCVLTGGSVSQLEVDPLYGGAILAQIFPFVVAGGDYAGRLSGFETGGSDLVYLATVFAPFLLALLPGVWALRLAGRSGRPWTVGLALPTATAPLLSLPGDAYELGSIVLTRLPWWGDPAARELLRGDDIGLRFAAVRAAVEAGVSAGWAWSGFALATILALAWAWGTVLASIALASRLGMPRPTRKMPAAAG